MLSVKGLGGVLKEMTGKGVGLGDREIHDVRETPMNLKGDSS